MNIALLGYDTQGRAAFEYWNTGDNQLTICDQNTAVKAPEGAKTKLGESYLEGLGEFDLLVRTPGLHPRDIVAANPDTPNILDNVTTVTNEFLRVCPTSNVVGVTGTKGKGTTSTLIAKILEASGKRVHLGGNIGIPPLDLLKNDIQTDDWVVLELANFQTIDIAYSPHISVCLMMVAEHMNWHADMPEYVDAKRQLFLQQREHDLMVYNADNHYSIDIARSSRAAKMWYSGRQRSAEEQINAEDKQVGAYVQNGIIYVGDVEICRTSEIALLGEHNWQNVCAAIAATWEVIGQNLTAIRSVVTTFKGLEHRLEYVATHNDVRYYDDSFGTTPETAIVAIRAFKEPKVVILGGSDKGASYDELAQTVADSNVRHAVLIGETAPAIEQALRRAGFTDITPGGDSMSEIVNKAKLLAAAGDVVLLSTACASFDMFANYKDRGEQFHKAVNAL